MKVTCSRLFSFRCSCWMLSCDTCLRLSITSAWRLIFCSSCSKHLRYSVTDVTPLHTHFCVTPTPVCVKDNHVTDIPLCYRHRHKTLVLQTPMCYRHRCYRHTCVTDTLVLQTHLCYRHTCVTDTLVLQTHLCYRHTCVTDTLVINK